MPIDSKLVFLRPADGTGRLVFGDDSELAAPATSIGVNATFAREPASTLSSTVQLLWSANVSRGEAIKTRVHWQAAQPTSALASSHWQPAQAVTARTSAAWQAAAPASALAASHWQSSQRHSARTAAVWQAGAPQRHTARALWQEASALRGSMGLRWQDAAAQRLVLLARYQEAVRLRTLALASWQTTGSAQQLRRQLRHTSGAGLPARLALALHWQQAMRPPAGLSVVIQPQPPEPDPCYDPLTLGRLEFTEAWAPNGRLVFVCRGADLPAAAVVVAVRSLYMVENNVALHRVPSGAEFRASQFNLRLDADSFTFSWSASLHSSARQHLTRSAPGEPVEVECAVNGTLMRLVVERIGRDRTFPADNIQVNGRGLAVELGSDELTFSNAAARTAQQLMGDALMVNGVPMGWTLDWQITDWLVPADSWVFRGSRMAALGDIASAAGAYLQPHRTSRVIRVLPRYPHAPWDWASLLVPDIELPVEVTSLEGTEEVIRPDYNQVHVGGVHAPGYFGPVRRGGTAGDREAPQVVHPLITAPEAHIQRGRAELSDTGVQEHLTLRTLVLPETGIILPGKSVRYVTEDGPRLGIVRGTQVSMSRWPVMHQTVEVETHVQ